MKTIKMLEEEIKEKECELAELKRRKIKFDCMTQEQRLATKLHERFCHFNHTDQCGWFYCEDDWSQSAQKNYIEKAEKILLIVKYETMLEILSVL